MNIYYKIYKVIMQLSIGANIIPNCFVLKGSIPIPT